MILLRSKEKKELEAYKWHGCTGRQDDLNQNFPADSL